MKLEGSTNIKVSRRLILAGGGVAAAMLPSLASGAGRDDRRPNIVWIVCHDIHAPLIGCYGNTLAHTPAIDGLASDGIRFDRAFTVAPVCAPSRFALVTGAYPQACAPAHQMRAEAQLPGALTPLPILMRAAGYYCTNNVFTDYNMAGNQGAMWDDCDIKAHWRNRPAGKPFFCVYNYLTTHESRIFGHASTETDPALVTVPDYLPDTLEVRKVLARNIDLVNEQDVAVAYILDQLKADQLDQDTIVFFMADHGGVHPRSKRYCYDDGLRVPLIVRIPAGFHHLAGAAVGKPSDRLVSHVDLAPTVLALAGVPIPSTIMGRAFLGIASRPRHYVIAMRDRMDERYDLSYAVRGHRLHYIRNYMPQRILGQHGAYEWQSAAYQDWERKHLAGELNEVQSRFWSAKPAEELYDLETDPHSIHNLIAEPHYRAEVDAMRHTLDQHILTTNDNGLIPEGDAEEGYNASRMPGAYPIGRVLEAANRAINRDSGNTPRFLAGLDDANATVRFWNATGLVLAGPPSTTTADTVAARLAAEQAESVRCGLAEVLLASDRHLLAVDTLISIAQRGSKAPYRIRALDILDTVPLDRLRPHRPAIAELTAVNNEYIPEVAKVMLLRIDNEYSPDKKVSGPSNFRIDPKKPIGNPQI